LDIKYYAYIPASSDKIESLLTRPLRMLSYPDLMCVRVMLMGVVSELYVFPELLICHCLLGDGVWGGFLDAS
jgi:hypothetical protein